MLLGFGAALRRSELVGLTLGDIESVPGKGILLTIARSKTDQHGQGQRVAVCANPTEPGFCPVVALDAWLRHRREAPDLDWTASASLRAERPLFCAVTRAGGGPADQAGRRRCRPRPRALLRPLAPPRPAHRRRREPGQLADLMRQSRHRSAQSVLGYIEPADLWRNNVTEGVFRDTGRRDGDEPG